MTPTDSSNTDLQDLPGHFIRRLQQIAVAVFLQETEPFGVTPVQYASLRAVQRLPGMDQRSLARSIGLDTSTMAGVIDRLESRGLMVRSASPDDRRVRLLSLTDEGGALLGEVEPAVLRAQKRMLEPLPRKDQQAFMRMLREIVEANNDLSRAPSQD
ncbi:MarR family winged helix-turn-helix transcriptional regulator [Variovorax sp. YR216]|uniref:MarR family winged helix-turn-helix transcriptional regulator n=1 Tax=Variovorax sp. YR216 TaxID=1882828 RepID=UPI00089A67F0|nr:MarR family winged helix-turn-helix transcriptional regulator [Variovorax sp. YR216]SEA71930.1 transcriptional regulator, MarR family [Variovorax sp. YR216]